MIFIAEGGIQNSSTILAKILILVINTADPKFHQLTHTSGEISKFLNEQGESFVHGRKSTSCIVIKRCLFHERLQCTYSSTVRRCKVCNVLTFLRVFHHVVVT